MQKNILLEKKIEPPEKSLKAIKSTQLVLLVNEVEKCCVPYDLSVKDNAEEYIKGLIGDLISIRMRELSNKRISYDTKENYSFYIKVFQSKVNDVIEDIVDDLDELRGSAKVIKIAPEIKQEVRQEPAKQNTAFFTTTTSYFNEK